MTNLYKPILFVISVSLSSLAFAGPNGGLADRINEARSYPNKLIEKVDCSKLENQSSKNIEEKRARNNNQCYRVKSKRDK
jgi:hypothetical protein